MRALEMTGVVGDCDLDCDKWRLGNVEGPSIGGVRVIAAFHDTFPENGTVDVTVLLAHGGDASLYRGEMWAAEGDQGYSSWTPGSSPDIWAGASDERGNPSFDLYERLVELEGQTVTLRIDDGPPLPGSRS